MYFGKEKQYKKYLCKISYKFSNQFDMTPILEILENSWDHKVTFKFQFSHFRTRGRPLYAHDAPTRLKIDFKFLKSNKIHWENISELYCKDEFGLFEI